MDAHEDKDMPGRHGERVRLISEEAAHWYIRCSDERVMRLADRRELVAWMRRSPENIAELLRVSDMDGRLGRQKLRKKLGIDDSNVIELGISSSTQQQRQQGSAAELLSAEEHDETMNNKASASWKFAALAAAVMAAVLLTFVVRDRFDNSVNTAAGQRQHTALPDGSVVHIGALSQLDLELTDEQRIVHLFAGEAVFEVAKDPTRPFIVRTPWVDVTAVGTRFEVSIGPGVTTTVSEGVVKVTARHDPENGKVFILRAGDQLRLPDGGFTEPAALTKVDAERKLEWANGWLVFQGETIGEAARQFNRRNVVQIKIAQPDIATRPLPGYYRFRVDSPESFAKNVAAAHTDIALSGDRASKVLHLQLE